MGCGKKHCSVNCSSVDSQFLKNLHDFPSRFTSPHYMGNAFSTYGDDDIDAWESEAKRWARVLFLAIKEEYHLTPIWMVCLHSLFLVCYLHLSFFCSSAVC